MNRLVLFRLEIYPPLIGNSRAQTSIHCPDSVANIHQLDRLGSAAARLSLEEVDQTLTLLRRTDQLLARNANKRLAMGVLLLGFPNLEHGAKPRGH